MRFIQAGNCNSQAFDGAAYGDQLTLPDISGGMALYFAISHAAAGNVILAIAEMD